MPMDDEDDGDDMDADPGELIEELGGEDGDAAPVQDDAARVFVEHRRGDVAVLIDDDGPGIPGRDMERVFSPFVRLENSRNTETGGVGLGLAIARSIGAAGLRRPSPSACGVPFLLAWKPPQEGGGTIG